MKRLRVELVATDGVVWAEYYVVFEDDQPLPLRVQASPSRMILEGGPRFFDLRNLLARASLEERP